MKNRFRLDRRRRVVVDGGVQRRIVLSVSVPMLAILAVVLGAQMIFDYKVRTGTLDVNGLFLGMPQRAVSAVLFFVFAVLYHTVHALHMSNKVAGAIHRMREDLRRYREGDLGHRTRLRHDDYLQDLASDINLTLDWVGMHAGQAPRERGSVTRPVAGAPEKASLGGR